MPRYSQMAASLLPTPAQEARGQVLRFLHQKLISLALNCGSLAVTPARKGNAISGGKMDITDRPASEQRTGAHKHCASGQCRNAHQPQTRGYLRRTISLHSLTAGLPKGAPPAPAARPRKMAASPPPSLKRNELQPAAFGASGADAEREPLLGYLGSWTTWRALPLPWAELQVAALPAAD